VSIVLKIRDSIPGFDPKSLLYANNINLGGELTKRGRRFLLCDLKALLNIFLSE
jgi:hypothetical protein